MRLVLIMVSAALLVVSVAGAASHGGGFRLRQVDQSAKTVTLAWNRQASADGYEFTLNGVVVSRAFDPTATRAVFWKGSRYGVRVLWRRADGRIVGGPRATLTPGGATARPRRTVATRAKHPAPGSKSTLQGPRLTFVPASRIDFRLRLVSETAKTITFAWKRQPVADGFQFVRNGVVVSRTFDRRTTRATFWKGFHYAVDLLRVSAHKRVTRLARAMAYTKRLVGGKASPNQPSPGSGSGSPAQPGGGSGAGSPPQPPASDFPNAANTGVPPGTTLRSCPTTITASGTYDACRFNGDVLIRANDVRITRSLINGQVDAGSGRPGQQAGLVISDSTIDCGCLSRNSSDTQPAIDESNFTLIRVDVFNAGHGVAVKDNVVVQDSYIHGLGGNTDAHKNGIYAGDGSNVKLIHNTIECDAPNGCTSAIGILTDFSDIHDWVIDNNLLNTVSGSYCLYGSGGPQKQYSSYNVRVTDNHFGRKYQAKCGAYGPVTYFDMSKPGMVWSGNIWDDTRRAVLPNY
jgi:hypothetical protein